MVLIFPSACLLVYVVSRRSTRAGRCRSRSFLNVPMTILSAIAGVWVTGGDNNVFTQSSF